MRYLKRTNKDIMAISDIATNLTSTTSLLIFMAPGFLPLRFAEVSPLVFLKADSSKRGARLQDLQSLDRRHYATRPSTVSEPLDF